MELIQWSEKISVHNERIDDQHKQLIYLTNTLIEQSHAASDSEIIGETLNELLKYTKSHFKEEEELLAKHNYPKLEEHKKKHTNFIYKVAMFCNDVLEGKKTVTQELLEFLTNWLTHHTSVDDQDYKNYI